MKLTDEQVKQVHEITRVLTGFQFSCATGMVRNGRREMCDISSAAVHALAEEVLASRAAAPKTKAKR